MTLMTVEKQHLLNSLAWTGGLFFLVTGIGNLFVSPPAAVWQITLGFWLTPSVRRWAEKRWSGLSSPLTKWGIGLMLLVMSIATMPAAKTSPGKSVEQAAAPAAQQPVPHSTPAVSQDGVSTTQPTVTHNTHSATSAAATATTLASTPAAVTQQTVSRVIDGDTLQLANGEVVRLIGINAP